MDTLQVPSKSNPLKVMIIADTHILGWREGHWFDKLRRYGEIIANDNYNWLHFSNLSNMVLYHQILPSAARGRRSPPREARLNGKTYI